MVSKLRVYTYLLSADMVFLLRLLASLLVTVGIGLSIVYFAGDTDLRSIVFAIAINWFLMFWAYAVQRLLAFSFSSRYYSIRPFKRRLIKWLGVPAFQRVLRKLSIFNPDLNLREGRSQLGELKRATKRAETAHVVIFVIIMGLTVYVGGQGWWRAAVWYLLFNALHNGYPVLVQRYNRMRIERIH